MKKIINTSIYYFIAAMVAGVFYRETTKYMQFTGNTSLSFVHTHLFVLGVVMFLMLIALFKDNIECFNSREFKQFYIIYNVSLPFFSLILMSRGITQVFFITLTDTQNAILAGIAGITHILMLVSFIFFYRFLRKHLLTKS